MLATGLQNSLFLILLVQCAGGQDLAGVLSALQGQAGEVLVKGDPDYESRRLVMNAACSDEPAVIVRPTSEADVSVIVRAARDADLPISIRSGGHSYTCTNIKQDSVHIDMRGMDSIQLTQDSSSPTGLAAILEPGATWGNVLRAIPTDRYSYPHGQCRSVGVAGYLLGGGVNWLGTYNKYGYGAENILSMRVVLADGRIAEVTAEKTEILSPTPSTVVHTESNNLFFALRGAGSSYGVATQFKYIVHEVPEAKPAILLAWADNSADLAAIKAAGQASPDYSVTISLEYAQDFWQNALASPIYRILFPPIMRILRRLGQLRDGTDSYPVFLTVTDIRPEAGRTTEVQRAVDHVKSQGVRLVLERDIAHRIFHIFGEILYERNIVEQEGWQNGEFYLSSFNFGNLNSHDSFEDVFFNDVSFGNKRSNFLDSVEQGCDYCFWMIHYRNRQSQTAISLTSPISTERSEDNPESLDTNLVCMFKESTSSCPALVERVKSSIESKISGMEPTYSKYANFPSCSASDWATRYWGQSFSQLQEIKEEWDPCNIFNHCQSVGTTSSSGSCCCPFSSSTCPSAPLSSSSTCSSTSTSTSTCLTTSGQACVFPFTYQGVVHNSCTLSGFPDPWCSTQTDGSGTHVTGNYGDCASSCPVEQETTTTSPTCSTTSGQACVFPFTYNGVQHSACTLSGFPTPWCSTATDGSGVHVTGNYGDCNDLCPIESNNPFPILGGIFGR